MDEYIGPSMPSKLNASLENEDDSLIGPVVPKQSKEIGPALPKDFKSKENNIIGPSLPPHLVSTNTYSNSCGPQLPPHLRKKDTSPPHENLEENIGPKLPAYLQKDVKEDEEEFGPALPPGLQNKSKKVVGPYIPPGLLSQSSDESDEEESIIGPLPPSKRDGELSREAIARDFEKRSQKMKDRLEGKEPTEKLKREEWMTELPPVLQGTLGVGARQFRARALDIGDRSGWTDTPSDKARKAKVKASGKEPQELSSHVAERDARINEQIKEFKGSDERQESLLSMHEKKRKRKLKEDEEAGIANVRRPFDRDRDLQVNEFDDATKKRMLKQSSSLSSRFSHGHTSGTFL